MSEMSIAAARETVAKAMIAAIPEKFQEVWLGPRSTEVSFRTSDGAVGTLTVSVKDMD